MTEKRDGFNSDCAHVSEISQGGLGRKEARRIAKRGRRIRDLLRREDIQALVSMMPM